jgi:hypothetical protein
MGLTQSDLEFLGFGASVELDFREWPLCPLSRVVPVEYKSLILTLKNSLQNSTSHSPQASAWG